MDLDTHVLISPVRHRFRTGPGAAPGCIGKPSVLAWTAVLSALAPIPGDAQTVTEIDDSIACSDCLIETGPPITLDAPADRLAFTSLPGVRVARDGEGNYVAAPLQGDALIAVFGPDGGYRSSHGRIGEGPGEFATDFPLFIGIGERDVIYAISPVHLHTLAPRAEASLDQVRMVVQATHVAILRDGIAVQATVRTEVGHTTIQMLRPDGTIRSSFGDSDAGTGRPGPGLRRVLGRSGDRVDVWSAHVTRYRITRYGPDGDEKARIERVSKWFPARFGLRPGAPYQAPASPTVSGIHEDGDGLLWVTISRAPMTFSPLVPRAGNQRVNAEVPLSPYVNLNRFLHTTVEVLDPVAGELVARRDFDERVRLVGTQGGEVLVYSLRPDTLGGLECVVTPLSLQRR